MAYPTRHRFQEKHRCIPARRDQCPAGSNGHGPRPPCCSPAWPSADQPLRPAHLTLDYQSPTPHGRTESALGKLVRPQMRRPSTGSSFDQTSIRLPPKPALVEQSIFQLPQSPACWHSHRAMKPAELLFRVPLPGSALTAAPMDHVVKTTTVRNQTAATTKDRRQARMCASPCWESPTILACPKNGSNYHSDSVDMQDFPHSSFPNSCCWPPYQTI